MAFTIRLAAPADLPELGRIELLAAVRFDGEAALAGLAKTTLPLVQLQEAQAASTL